MLRSLSGIIKDYALFGRLPGQLIIQYSDACNAKCPQCELRAGVGFARSQIGMDDTKRMIDAAAAMGVKSLSITGGEPFLYRGRVVELITYAVKAGIPYTRTGTNGFMFARHDRPGFEKEISCLADDLYEAGLYTFWISIDSAVPSVHEGMRGLPGVIEGIAKALPLFHEHGLFPAANLGINRNTGGNWEELIQGRELDREGFYRLFRGAFDRFYGFVADLGFTMANACYPMSIQTSGNDSLETAYGAFSADHVVSFTPAEKAELFRALYDTIPLWRGGLRIFTPRTNLYTLSKEYETGEVRSFPCRGGLDYFFITAQEGDTCPCCFRGRERLGKFWEMETSSLPGEAWCRDCDWECFRDPSELSGPLIELRKAPYKLFKRWRLDRQHFRLWKEDLLYYRACSFFSGRKAPDYEKMKKFQRSAEHGEIRPRETSAARALPENAPAVLHTKDVENFKDLSA